jgi:hypothetical protein
MTKLIIKLVKSVEEKVDFDIFEVDPFHYLQCFHPDALQHKGGRLLAH